MKKSNFLSQSLTEWFEEHKRDLPWRKNISPYRVWVSEVMLQQTQVKTVIPYFLRWMKAFPTLEALATAPIEKVIKLWEGLGYYSRARNLHKGAKEVIEKYKGVFPSEKEELLKICGIGPYTSSAILSFAFNKSCCLVDGNVKRVMSRFWNLRVDYSKPSHYRELEQRLLQALPPSRHWVFNEGLMELGALVCTPKNPACSSCPLQEECEALRLGTQNSLPLKKERAKTEHLQRTVLVFKHQDQLLVQRQSSDLMKDLYEFFYLEHDKKTLPESLPDFLKWQTQAEESFSLPTVKHSFTRYRVTLLPYLLALKKRVEIKNFEWIDQSRIKSLPFSSGHRKILSYLEEVLTFSLE